MIQELNYTNNGKYFISYPMRFILPNGCKRYNEKSKENLVQGYVNNGISSATKKKILIRCRVLNYIAETKRIDETYRDTFNHKTSFITLTLPSRQIHKDQDITKIVLGTFLDNCRKIGILKNYVWRAEKQKNNNLHYHILTDSYANKNVLYRLWLLSLEKLGYISAYKNKFINMNLCDYRKLEFNKNISDSKVSLRYWKGKKNNWCNPPCYDSKNILENESIENYISKYISKESDYEKENVKGRLWGCSSNINKGVELLKNDYDFNEFGFKMAKYVLKGKSIVGEYFEIIEMTISRVISWYKSTIGYIYDKMRELIPPCKFHEKDKLIFSYSQ